jgi:hypothetical protein
VRYGTVMSGTHEQLGTLQSQMRKAP